MQYVFEVYKVWMTAGTSWWCTPSSWWASCRGPSAGWRCSASGSSPGSSPYPSSSARSQHTVKSVLWSRCIAFFEGMLHQKTSFLYTDCSSAGVCWWWIVHSKVYQVGQRGCNIHKKKKDTAIRPKVRKSFTQIFQASYLYYTIKLNHNHDFNNGIIDHSPLCADAGI